MVWVAAFLNHAITESKTDRKAKFNHSTTQNSITTMILPKAIPQNSMNNRLE
uniref:Uncharacterized protein n=1 Tax=Rhizophora mucronata TaxID=61149 RepID=A0A2P2P6U3_RHIMU